MAAREPPGTGLPRSLRALGANLMELVWARAELIGVEWQEEKERASQKLILIGVAALFLASGLLFAGALVIVLFWDTHRELAAGGVTLLYLGIGAWAVLRLREMSRTSPPPFAATRGEFANDFKLMRGHDE
jgi:uncharacterized membrane protein YqjE